jgi:predicted nuclease of restriction endonuclease-like RecB superfamily
MGNPDAHIITIMVVEVTRNGTLKGVDMSFMLTSRHYIPADSSHEMQMAEALVDAGRTFTKPLRYDDEAEFPDFRLQDQESECVVEVWGMMGNPDYEARKAEKIKSYKSRGVQVIEWDTRRPMPNLSRLARRGATAP